MNLKNRKSEKPGRFQQSVGIDELYPVCSNCRSKLVRRIYNKSDHCLQDLRYTESCYTVQAFNFTSIVFYCNPFGMLILYTMGALQSYRVRHMSPELDRYRRGIRVHTPLVFLHYIFSCLRFALANLQMTFTSKEIFDFIFSPHCIGRSPIGNRHDRESALRRRGVGERHDKSWRETRIIWKNSSSLGHGLRRVG